ncbi:MAG: hypothetical protein NTY53_14505 [Kiritimatiellaeota bacterium]|nr:hypothetical protein [Kiritimatiellota bacterium]
MGDKLITPAVSALLVLCLSSGFGCQRDRSRDELVRQHLLNADHPALVTACREMIQARDEYARMWKSFLEHAVVWDAEDGALNGNVPEAIRAQNPRRIMIYTNHIVVVLHTDASRIAFVGFTEEAEEFGTTRLTNGLWYWRGVDSNKQNGQQSAAPLPPAPQPGPSGGAR